MPGLSLAQQCHIVPVVLPQNVTGGAFGQAFSMKSAAHVTIVISVGALAAQLSAVTINQCTNAAGAGATPIAFKYASQTTAGPGNDVLSSSFTFATSAGFIPPNTPNVVYVIEMDSQELADGSAYIQVALANGANANFVSVVAILSGVRHKFAGNPSATV